VIKNAFLRVNRPPGRLAIVLDQIFEPTIFFQCLERKEKKFKARIADIFLCDSSMNIFGFSLKKNAYFVPKFSSFFL